MSVTNSSIALSKVSSPAFVEERNNFLRISDGLVDWVRLGNGKKSPSGYRNGKLFYSKKVPQTRNVGAHPTGRTVIFDIDTKTSLTPDEQIVGMNKFLGVDLKGSLTVSTPSGGRHIYVQWPVSVPLPGNWKLDRFNDSKLFSGEFSGDLRSAETKGHCVIPGSIFENITYRVIDDSPVKEINESGARAFYELYTSLDKVYNEGVKAELELKNDNSSAHQIKDIDPRRTAKLRIMLEESGYKKWHQKRAAVYNALSCCHAPNIIQMYWEKLGINKDSASDSPIKPSYLEKEFSKLSPSVKHGGYCSLGTLPRVDFETMTSNEKLLASLMRMKRSSTVREARVLHEGNMIQALNSGRKNPGKYYQLAVAIIEDFLQPWSNFGVARIMLGSAFLSDFYDVPSLNVESAKRLLIRKGIIHVDVKQAPGRMAVFSVDSSFVDEKMSKLLRHLRVRSNADVFYDSRNGMFYNGGTGEIVMELEWFAKNRILNDEAKELQPDRLSPVTVLSHVMRVAPEVVTVEQQVDETVRTETPITLVPVNVVNSAVPEKSAVREIHHSKEQPMENHQNLRNSHVFGEFGSTRSKIKLKSVLKNSDKFNFLGKSDNFYQSSSQVHIPFNDD